MARDSERWIQSSTVIPMFPTLVWKLQLEPRHREEIDAAIVPALEEMRLGLPKLERGCGWQSERGLHTRQEFQKLSGCVMSAAEGVLRADGSMDATAVEARAKKEPKAPKQKAPESSTAPG